MRIAIGGLSHETSTFVNTRTTADDFAHGFGLFRGEEIIERFRGANMCTGGFLDAARNHGFDVAPLLWGFAYPRGLIVGSEYAALKREFLDRLRQQLPLDGVLLDQHGAMVVEGLQDADGDFIAAVREAVGPDCPIAVTFDLHGNHTPQRMAAAEIVCGYDTYPHVDMADRGREAADLLVRTIRREIRPQTAFRSVPLFWSASCQVTAHAPMNELIAHVHALEQRPGILTITVATGFPWADIPEMGPSVTVIADGDGRLAESTADELAAWIWERRAQWLQPSPSVGEALAQGDALGRFPIILADQADNTGGGAPGDSTEILQTFLDRQLRDALVLYIVDPAVAERAHAAGVGSVLEVDVGGKSDPVQGPPVHMRATVRAVSHGAFRYDGPMYAGLTGNMGCSAWLEQDGVHAVVVTAAEQPLGPAFAKSLGIDCTQMRYIAVKSAVHFRASFEPIAGSIFNVNARAIQTHDFAALTYHHRRRPMFPLD